MRVQLAPLEIPCLASGLSTKSLEVLRMGWFIVHVTSYERFRIPIKTFPQVRQVVHGGIFRQVYGYTMR